MKFLILMLFSTFVFAEPLNVSWDTAKFRTDGSPYPLEDRGGSRIKYWAGTGVQLLVDTGNPSVETFTIDVPPGNYSFRVMHYDSSGVDGAFTAVFTKVVPPKTTAPPGLPSNVR